MKVYEIRDNSNDEVYFTCGIFSSLDEAINQIQPDKVGNLANYQTEEGEDLSFEVHEHELDEVGESKRVYQAVFECTAHEEEDDFSYTYLQK